MAQFDANGNSRLRANSLGMTESFDGGPQKNDLQSYTNPLAAQSSQESRTGVEQNRDKGFIRSSTGLGQYATGRYAKAGDSSAAPLTRGAAAIAGVGADILSPLEALGNAGRTVVRPAISNAFQALDMFGQSAAEQVVSGFGATPQTYGDRFVQSAPQIPARPARPTVSLEGGLPGRFEKEPIGGKTNEDYIRQSIASGAVPTAPYQYTPEEKAAQNERARISSAMSGVAQPQNFTAEQIAAMEQRYAQRPEEDARALIRNDYMAAKDQASRDYWAAKDATANMSAKDAADYMAKAQAGIAARLAQASAPMQELNRQTIASGTQSRASAQQSQAALANQLAAIAAQGEQQRQNKASDRQMDPREAYISGLAAKLSGAKSEEERAGVMQQISEAQAAFSGRDMRAESSIEYALDPTTGQRVLDENGEPVIKKQSSKGTRADVMGAKPQAAAKPDKAAVASMSRVLAKAGDLKDEAQIAQVFRQAFPAYAQLPPEQVLALIKAARASSK